MLTDTRLRLFAVALLALVARFPATAHHASADILADAATAADTAKVVEGTLLAVVRVRGSRSDPGMLLVRS
jgi:hypothetical protein